MYGGENLMYYVPKVVRDAYRRAAKTNGSKLTALLDSLHHIQRTKPDEKAIVFTQFRETHKMVLAALKAASIRSVSISGSMTQTARGRALRSFAEDPTVKVFVLTLKSAAVGLSE